MNEMPDTAYEAANSTTCVNDDTLYMDNQSFLEDKVADIVACPFGDTAMDVFEGPAMTASNSKDREPQVKASSSSSLNNQTFVFGFYQMSRYSIVGNDENRQ